MLVSEMVIGRKYLLLKEKRVVECSHRASNGTHMMVSERNARTSTSMGIPLTEECVEWVPEMGYPDPNAKFRTLPQIFADISDEHKKLVWVMHYIQDTEQLERLRGWLDQRVPRQADESEIHKIIGGA